MRQKRWIAAAVLAYPVLMFVAALPGEDYGSAPMVVLALGGTAVFGALVGRWWAAFLPVVWSGIWLLGFRVNDWITGGCSVCGSDSDWSNAWVYMVFLVTAPLTLAILVGLALGWAVRVSGRRRGGVAPPPRTAG